METLVASFGEERRVRRDHDRDGAERVYVQAREEVQHVSTLVKRWIYVWRLTSHSTRYFLGSDDNLSTAGRMSRVSVRS